MDGGLHTVVHGRVWEDGFMVEQVALGVETHHLAARPEARVDTHDTLLAQRRRKQQLTQIFGKHADGFFVGLLLAQVDKFGLDARFEQPSVAVLHSLGNQPSAGCVTVDVVALQALDTLVVVGRNAEPQDALGLAPEHGQQAVAGAAFQGFLPVEVVAVLGGLVGVGLGFHHLRRDDGLATEGTAHLLSAALVLAHHLGYDVLGALDGGFRVGHLVGNKGLCGVFGVAFALQQQCLGQRFQALLTGYLGTCAALGTIGQIDVLQFGGVPRRVDAFLQFGRHFTEVGDGFYDGFLTFLYLFQPLVGVADGCYLYFVQPSRALLAVAGDEGDGATLVQEGQRAGYILLRNVEPCGYEL